MFSYHQLVQWRVEFKLEPRFYETEIYIKIRAIEKRIDHLQASQKTYKEKIDNHMNKFREELKTLTKILEAKHKDSIKEKQVF